MTSAYPGLFPALLISAFLAPLGGLMAGIITYKEYSQHRLERGRALGEALLTAGFAMLVLTLCGAGAGFLFT